MPKHFRTYISLLSSLLIYNLAQAQNLGNEWINYNQQYFKFKITQKGIYQISFTDLKTAGFPTNINPEKIQLFRRGQEQAIFVKGEEDKRFDETDLIEFYAEGNDGKLDSLLYSPTLSQPHQYYSLYSDTASYFLTYRLDNQIGKRIKISQKSNSQNLKPEPFHVEETLQLFTSSYAEGQPDPIGVGSHAGVLNSNYGYGRGWSGDVQNKNIFVNFDFNLRNFIKIDAQKPQIEVLFTGRSAGGHLIETWLGNSPNQRLLDTTISDNYFNKKINKIVNFQDITNNIIRLSTRSVGSQTDQYSVSYLKLTYPQSFDMLGISEKVFNLPKSSNQDLLISIPNAPEGIQLYDISDKNNLQKFGFTKNGTAIESIVSGQQILATNQIKKVSLIEPISFRNISNSKSNYLIINHKSLSKYVKDYATYRASAIGGKYDTLSVDIDLLYNLFTFGDKNPLAIKRFLSLMLRNGKPEFAFLIGYATNPQKSRKSLSDYQIDLVPTVGYPGGDVPFTMGLNGTETNFSSLAIGRLATDNPETVLHYLNKVKEHEANPMDALWRKTALKMSGGRSIGELTSLRQYTEEFKAVCENGLFGQKVDLLAKKTDNPVEFINVTERVNQGVGMIMMFGHSAPGQTDMDIGFCSNDLLGYKNKGKYPLVLINGCDAGDLFGVRTSFGTDWVNTPNRGAILFLAHSNLGYPFALKTYSDEIYNAQFTDSLMSDKPFGTIIKESSNRHLKKNFGNIYAIGNAQQFTLQGDPAVALFATQKPDYEVNSTSIFLKNIDKNNPLTANADSLKVGIIVSNLGRVSTKKLSIGLKRMYANGAIDDFGKMFVNPINFQDTLYFNIRNDKNLSVGNNRFEITLDLDNQILETRENNNSVVFEYNFSVANINILSPKEFSIVNQKDLSFILQIPSITNNSSVIIELDSSKNHSSSFKKSFTGTAPPLLNWKANLLDKDSTVYYVRTKLSTAATWIESSFIYIKNGTEGFAQNSFSQLEKSTTDNQIILEGNNWKFPESSAKISAKIYGWNSGVSRPYRSNYVLLNDKVLLGDGVCYPWQNFNAVAFSRALRPYSVLPRLVCGYAPYSVNYLSSEPSTTDIEDYFTTTPSGNHVMIWNSGYVDYGKLTSENLKRFSEIGVDTLKIKRLTPGTPFFVIGRKGAKKANLEVFPNFDRNPDTEILSIDNFEVKDQFNEGLITSPLIGPASEWGDISLKIQQNDVKNQSYSFDIIGVNFQGEEVILQKNIQTNQLKINTIDVKKYPFLKLKLTLKTNDFFGKAPQLKSWIVSYKGVPEGVVDVIQSSKILDKQEYEDFTANIWFKNISNKNFKDSVTVRQILSNRSLNKQVVKLFKIKALSANDSVKISIPVQTAGQIGDNLLSVFFNPQTQPEQIYFNNSIDYNFSVIPDKINPILSVTFDGKQIQNNEIVSAKPLIQISLRDENLFRIKTDTLGLEMYLKSCKKCNFKRIYFKDPSISWKANPTDNNFIIKYLTQITTDDTLTLQVQGRDVAGNLAGSKPYTISFRIIQKQEVKPIIVYPNPFELFTKFSFVITGSEVPDEFKIEVFNNIGQLVKTIDDSKQNLRVGLNEYIWDGTDLYGGKLPVGVYFYRITLKNKGMNLSLESGGKLVLIR
jgi:Peptidase family C25/FlgD Ig-like domain